MGVMYRCLGHNPSDRIFGRVVLLILVDLGLRENFSKLIRV